MGRCELRLQTTSTRCGKSIEMETTNVPSAARLAIPSAYRDVDKGRNGGVGWMGRGHLVRSNQQDRRVRMLHDGGFDAAHAEAKPPQVLDVRRIAPDI
jgi:hypothetical protein